MRLYQCSALADASGSWLKYARASRPRSCSSRRIGAESAAYAAGVWVRRAANKKRFICVMASSARSNCSGVSIIEDYLHNATLFHVASQLIDAQPGGQYCYPDGLSSPEDVRFEEQ